MSPTMNGTSTTATPDFQRALAAFPAGYVEGHLNGRRWGSTVKRSDDGSRVWLFAEELGGGEIVSFNLYLLSSDRPMLRPCEMASEKVTEFVIAFVPDRKI
nr:MULTISPECIES: hypothetical protein [unclassified Rhizobium]